MCVLVSLVSCSENEEDILTQPLSKSKFQTNVIYGEDNRKDWYEVLDKDVKSAASATLGIVDQSSVQFVDDYAVVHTSNTRLCPTEKFHNQKKGPYCSGFLVGPDLVLTAGHCIETEAQCQSASFIFDFAMKSRQHNPARISKSNVYSCRKLVGREYTNLNQDWALIRLDRPVTDRQPLKIERTNSLKLKTPLTIIGHPTGLPSKISRGGSVHRNSEHYFVADLDSFGGNSGSAVLNAETLRVEGILVRGRMDYRNVKGCLVSNICEEGIGTKCTFPNTQIEGEHVSKTITLASIIPPIEEEYPEPEPEPEDPIDENRLISRVMLPIPDSSLKKIQSRIVSSIALNGSAINLRLVVEHPFISDLKITLISPDEIRLVVHNHTGVRVRNINGVYGQDLKSFEDFSKLGSQPAGTWTLEITDQSPFDKGYLIEWEILPEANPTS